MKQLNFFVAAATMLCTAVWAQPEINRSNVNTTNFEAEFYYSPADGFNVGGAGADQVWDFSDLDLMYLGTDITLPVATSPYASTFPTANYCYKYDGLFGQTGKYYYHNITANKYDILSIGYNGVTGHNYNADPRTFMVFPYNFNDTYTDTYISSADGIQKNVTATYDGYGSVIMPYGTFENVVRQKIVTNGVTDYIWFNVEPFYPILQTVLAENSLGITKNMTPLGIEDQIKTKFTVSPNPTSGNFSINTDYDFSEGSEITVYNSIGQCVLRQQASFSNNISLNIDNQPSGLYFISISDKNNAVVHTEKSVKK